MTAVLHITNGDSAAKLMRDGGVQGTILPWRDVLHEGPVPADKSLEQMSLIRAKYIADCGWGEFANLVIEFQQRDRQLKTFNNYDNVVLWFEHDLYDQLQILQILDWFVSQNLSTVHLELICTVQYLGRMTPTEIAGHQRYRKEISEDQITLGGLAWQAFCSKTPEKWCGLLGANTAALPYLGGAVLRMLEEYPSFQSGLGRTEARALRLLADKPQSVGQLFHQNQQLEDRVYLGDASYWNLINKLLVGDQALLKLSSGNTRVQPADGSDLLQLTEIGLEVHNGAMHRMSLPWAPYWIGGVRISADSPWCWNAENMEVCLWQATTS
jgi:hypothetical protein